jgi:hypothetical protein
MFATVFNSMKKYYLLFIAIIFAIAATNFFVSCAVIVPPSGGPKDSIPPVLVSALPKDSTLHFTGNKIVLTFDEYVDVKEVQQNLIMSPNPEHLPTVEYKLNDITIKLKDSLEPNTTYTLDFGNSIKDVNEGNIAKRLSYVFSTGSYLDNGELHGNVKIAETGKIDSTLIVILHSNWNDTAIQKIRPLYYTKLDSSGNFYFTNLPYGRFAVYALENSYSKRYDDSTKMFAFLDSTVKVQASTDAVALYAFQEEKRKEKKTSSPATTSKKKTEQQLPKNIKVKLESDKQDLLTPLNITFSQKYQTIDTSKIILCDTFYQKLNNYSFELDTLQEKISIHYNWKEDEKLIVLMDSSSVEDSLGNTLAQNDTLKFTTKKQSEYGSLKLLFNNVDTVENQVVQIVSKDKIIQSIIVTQREWSIKLFVPGEYQLLELYDRNKNGKWDTGNFKEKIQPEIVKDLKKKFSVKADWDNEVEVDL